MASDEKTATGGQGYGTRIVHAGEERRKAHGSLTTPVYHTATYTFRDSAELRDFREGRITRYEYGRYGNPTQTAVERKLADLEGGEAALLVSSGMCAVTTTFLALLGSGSHFVVTHDCYRKTRQFCKEFLPKLGVDYTVVQTGDEDAMEAAIQKSTRLIFSESPTNPYMNIVDIDRFVEIGKRHKVKTILDSTFATPVNLRPLTLGVDLVIHSATKFLGGHNDLIAGAVIGSEPLIQGIRDMAGLLGGITDPQTCYLLLRGMKTLHLRVERQNASAQKIAEFLEKHPKVRRVYYPGLKSHPHHEVAKRRMTGFGGVVTFEVDGGLEEGIRVVDAVRIPYIAPSLGGVESLIEQPILMSYGSLAEEDRKVTGIKENLIRLSVGIEDVDDLIADLDQALSKI